MDEKQLQLLWDLHGKNGGFSSFDEFKGLMDDPNSRKVFFDETNKDLGFKDYDEFENTLGVKKKRISSVLVPEPSIANSNDFSGWRCKWYNKYDTRTTSNNSTIQQ